MIVERGHTSVWTVETDPKYFILNISTHKQIDSDKKQPYIKAAAGFHDFILT